MSLIRINPLILIKSSTIQLPRLTGINHEESATECCTVGCLDS